MAMGEDSGARLEQLVEQARAAVEAVAGGETGPFVGEAAEGLIRCEVGADGRVVSLEVAPDALLRPRGQWSAQVVVAVNRALAAAGGARVDTAAWLEGLREVQESSVVQMRAITQAFTTALRERVDGS